MRDRAYQVSIIMKILLILVACLTMATIASAEEWKRSGRVEYYGLLQNMGGDKTYGSGVMMEIGSTSAIGIGYGSNFSNHLNLNMDMWLGSTNVTGKALGVTVKGNTTLLGWDANLDINILQSRFTPIVSGGVGFISFSGDVVGFPFSETDLSYNYGGGFRWDVTDNFLLKTIYRTTRTTLKETDKALMLSGAAISICFIF